MQPWPLPKPTLKHPQPSPGADCDMEIGSFGPGTSANHGQNSTGGNSSAEINRLSSELNSRLSKELDDMMSSVNTQIQRAISDAISGQISPQIQSVLNAGSGQSTLNRWNVPSERPEVNSEETYGEKAKKSNRSEQRSDFQNGSQPNLRAYDMVTGDNESPIEAPEILTGRMPPRNHLHSSHDNFDPLLDTTIPAQERNVQAPELDPINRLADVLTSMQNRPSAQQLTIRPVNSNTMTFDGKSEKKELFEDLFHTMIKMQPEMSEQMKINHFHSLLRKNALQTFRNISTANRQTLEDVLVIFRRKYVKPESQATAKHKWHRLVFDPNTTKLPNFLEELNQGAEKAFGDNAQRMIDSLLYAKLPPKLKRSVNMARLENGSYNEIVAHLERELELNALEESDDLPMASMTSSTPKNKTVPSKKQISDITCNYCKEKGHIVKDCEKLKYKKEKEAQQGKPSQKKTLNAVLVAKRTILERDLGREQVRTLHPNAPDQRTRQTMILTLRPPNPTTSQHHPALKLHPAKMTKKTSFATTPIQPISLRPTIHQIGPSN